MKAIRFNRYGATRVLFHAVLLLWTAPLLAGSTASEFAPSLQSLYRLSPAKTRSISAENPTGEVGKGGMAVEGSAQFYARNLGQGWKISPSVKVRPGESFTMADYRGAGAVQHIWLTPTGNWRRSVLRIYWDDEKEPSVEVPVGDFFAEGWGEYARIDSLAVAVNPGSAFNSYWTMPFKHGFRMTLENRDRLEMTLYYQIDFTVAQVPNDAAYFHAQFRRMNPTKFKQPYVILDGIRGQGQYVGTYMAYGIHRGGWWGEGEVKFFIDDDKAFPTIAGTGTEDYFGGSYNFTNPNTHQYEVFTGAYTGMPQVIRPEDADRPTRFGLYRWHINDPIRFKKQLKVEVQMLGWQKSKEGESEFRPLEEDVSSVAFWYQSEPHTKFPPLPSKESLEYDQ